MSACSYELACTKLRETGGSRERESERERETNRKQEQGRVRRREGDGESERVCECFGCVCVIELVCEIRHLSCIH